MDSNNPNGPGCYTQHGVSGYGVAAKLSRKEPMNEVFVKGMAEKMMLTIADKCMELGARCIGHIKCHLRTEAGTIKADTIGTAHGSYSTGTLTEPVKDLYIAINSIIQGIPEDAVKAATLEGMHEMADQRGISVVKEKEHTYFDEFDFVASKKDYIKQLEEQLTAGDNQDSDQEK
ncbi:MAG: hypothetical protein LJE96_02610 [Deltaproteobacteria bacterium]|nr:hypothetical protein [Deltaproteobacteria bacterium]